MELTFAPRTTTSASCDEQLYARHVIKQMRGGSRSLLILDQHFTPWVVKFRDNPQHRNVLVNEYVASRIGRRMGFTIPPTEPIWVSEDIAEALNRWIPHGRAIYQPGLHVGSRYVGGLMPGLVLDILPSATLARTTNRSEAAGISVLDLWLSNTDNRQAVYARTAASKRYTTFWIDFGHCFGGATWNLEDHRVLRRAQGNLHYVCFGDYENWIGRAEGIPPTALIEIFDGIPSAWRIGRHRDLKRLLSDLLARTASLRTIVRNYVPNEGVGTEQIRLLPPIADLTCALF